MQEQLCRSGSCSDPLFLSHPLPSLYLSSPFPFSLWRATSFHMVVRAPRYQLPGSLCRHSSKGISCPTHFHCAVAPLSLPCDPNAAFLSVSPLVLWIVVVISPPIISCCSLPHCRYSCSCNGYSKAASYTGHLPILASEVSSHTQGMDKLQV
jgi:hypothetical protein